MPVTVNMAYFIHTNTDVVILTIFSSLSNVSVYSIYLLIVNALKSLVNSISQAILPSFGNVLAQNDKDKIDTAFDYYEFGISTISVFLFSCGIALITPFVDVYTNNISDAAYHQPLFGTILCLAEMVYCFRDPYIAAAYSANRFKQVSKFAVIEAASNIVISICLVFKFGIVGVAIGTLVSMLYRMIAHIVYLKGNVLYRPIKKSVINIIQNGICSLLIILAASIFKPKQISSYFEWVLFALLTSIIAALLIIVKCYICNKRFIVTFFKKLSRRKDFE